MGDAEFNELATLFSVQQATDQVDPYAVLGVGRTATAGEIRAAYHDLATRYHPDRHQGNPLATLAGEKLTELNRAYEALSTPTEMSRPPRARTRAARAYQATTGEGIATPVERTPRKYGSLILLVALIPLVIRFGDATARTLRSFIVELLGGLALIEDSSVAAVVATLVLTVALLFRVRHKEAVKRGKTVA